MREQTAPRDPGAAGRLGWPPLAVLALALSTVFLFSGDRDRFYRSFGHDWNSARWLAFADGLTAERPFAFEQMTRRDNGTVRYDLYNRFPIGGLLLVKLVTTPFGGDLSAQLLAGRVLMLTLFALAAVLAYLSLVRLVGSRALAMGATLLAFSSYNMLRYSDMISTEASPDLFAVLLVFHGVVRYEMRPGRRRFMELLARVCVAPLLGWHVIGLMLPFLALGLVRESVRARRAGRPRIQAVLAALGSRYVLLGAAGLLFAVLALGYNLAAEHVALGGKRAVADLPSAQSMLRRFGQHPLHPGEWSPARWRAYLKTQLHRVGGMSLPYALPGPRAAFGELPWADAQGWTLTAVGVGALAVCAVGIPFARRKQALPGGGALLVVLALSGPCWAVLMRYHNYDPWHDYESAYFVGVSLVLFTLLLLGATALVASRWRRCATLCLAGGAVAIFAWSNQRMAHAGRYADVAAFERRMMAEFETIGGSTRGKDVLVLAGHAAVHRAMRMPAHLRTHRSRFGITEDESGRKIFYYYMAGAVLRYAYHFGDAGRREAGGKADFVLAFERAEVAGLLTPTHRHVFLYEPGGVVDAVAEAELGRYRRLAARQPATAANFDIHVVDTQEEKSRELVYLKAPCDETHTQGRFTLRLDPVRREDLGERAVVGFDFIEFAFDRYGVLFDDRCMMRIPLPRYHIAKVTAGQFAPGDLTWRAVFFWNLDRFRAAWRRARSGRPAARGAFDVHVGHVGTPALTYVREPCAPEDVTARFFLHVVPRAVGDLPPARRRSGFDNLDFDFNEQGVMMDGACVAEVPLPAYRVGRVTTGQFSSSQGTLWRTAFEVSAK